MDWHVYYLLWCDTRLLWQRGIKYIRLQIHRQFLLVGSIHYWSSHCIILTNMKNTEYPYLCPLK